MERSEDDLEEDGDLGIKTVSEQRIESVSTFPITPSPAIGSHCNTSTHSMHGIASNVVSNAPIDVYCGGIPYSLTEDQIRAILSRYGQLRSFFLAKDMTTGMSRGYCFFQFRDSNVTDIAINALNGMQIGGRRLELRQHTSSMAMGAVDWRSNGSQLEEDRREHSVESLLGNEPQRGGVFGDPTTSTSNVQSEWSLYSRSARNANHSKTAERVDRKLKAFQRENERLRKQLDHRCAENATLRKERDFWKQRGLQSAD